MPVSYTESSLLLAIVEFSQTQKIELLYSVSSRQDGPPRSGSTYLRRIHMRVDPSRENVVRSIKGVDTAKFGYIGRIHRLIHPNHLALPLYEERETLSCIPTQEWREGREGTKEARNAV